MNNLIKTIYITIFITFFLISCKSLPKKNRIIPEGNYIALKDQFIAVDSVYFVEVKETNIEVEYYSIYKGIKIEKEVKTLNRDINNIIYKSKEFEITNNELDFYIDGFKLQKNNYLLKNECGDFCNFHKDFLSLSIDNKILVCRNAEFRYRKFRELQDKFGIIDYNILKKIDVLLPHADFKKQIDLSVKSLTKSMIKHQ